MYSNVRLCEDMAQMEFLSVPLGPASIEMTLNSKSLYSL